MAPPPAIAYWKKEKCYSEPLLHVAPQRDSNKYSCQDISNWYVRWPH
jgi:hypothetical protein